jgi:hypothetical protein
MSSCLGPLARHLLPLGVHAVHSAPCVASHHSYLSVSAVRSTGRHSTPDGPCRNAEPPRRVSLGESGEHRCAIFFSRRCTTSPSASPSPQNTAAVAPSLFYHARLSSTAPAAIPPTGRCYSPHRAGDLRHHTSTRHPSESKFPAVTVDRRCRVSTSAVPPSRRRVHLPHQLRTLAAPPSRPGAATVFFLNTEHLLHRGRPTRSSTRRGMPAPELHHRVGPLSTARSPQPQAPSAELFQTFATAPSTVIPAPCW